MHKSITFFFLHNNVSAIKWWSLWPDPTGKSGGKGENFSEIPAIGGEELADGRCKLQEKELSRRRDWVGEGTEMANWEALNRASRGRKGVVEFKCSLELEGIGLEYISLSISVRQIRCFGTIAQPSTTSRREE